MILQSKEDLEKFKVVHEKIKKYGALHVAAILVTYDSRGWYEPGLKYISTQVDNGSIEPQIHGYDHIDYAPLDEATTRSHINSCIDFTECSFGRTPTIWYTPWGANTSRLQRVANEFRLTLVDCSNINQTHKIVKALRGRNRAAYVEQYKKHGEVMIHYWQGKSVNALDEVLEALK